MSRWKSASFGSSSWEEIPQGPGCYVFFLEGKPGYIGFSIRLRARIGGGKGGGTHRITLASDGNTSTPWGSFKSVVVKFSESNRYGEEAMREARLIHRLRPKFNRIGLDQPKSMLPHGPIRRPEIRKDRPPAFLFYAKDWLDWKVLRMSDAAQGIYIRLLAFMWKDSPDQCSLPDDDKQIAKVIGKRPSQWRKLRSEIMLVGDPLFAIEEGRLVSHRLQREKANQDLRRKRLGEAGRKGASKRWRGDADANGDDMARPMASGYPPQPRLSVSSSSSSSSSDPEPDPKKDPVSPPASSEKGTPKKLPKNPPLTEVQIVTFVNSWNVMARTAGLSECLLPLTEARKKKLRSRRCDPLFRDKWPEVLRRLGASTFCRGRAGSRTQGATPWKASFDWVIHSEENFRKVLEGKYDDDEDAERTAPKRPYERPHNFAS